MVVHPFDPRDQLVAHARANPGKLSYGSFGLGSSGHISMRTNLLGVDIVHVLGQAQGPAVTDLLADRSSS